MRKFFLNAAVAGSVLLAGCGGGGTADAPQTSAPPVSSFAGTVVDKNGAPIAGVTISVYRTNDHIEWTTVTDVNGAYSFSGLSANFPYGNYEVHAKKSGYGFTPAVGASGTVAKADHNALFRTVLTFSSASAANIAGANFVGSRSGDKVVQLPKTGQSASYAAGDDAAAQRGVAWPATRFIDNQDGTVTDALTGLIWLQDAGCFSAGSWSAAFTAAAQLANGACGLSDGSTVGQWRMPNVAELESLLDASRSSPALHTTHPFANVGTTYWTSTTYRGDTFAAWVIRLTDGRYINDSVANAKSTAYNLLWAVRSSNAAAAIHLPATGQFIVYANRDDASLVNGARLTYPRFIDNGDGTVADTVTGLIWLKRANCIRFDWSGALSAIAGLASGQCGLTDGSAAGQWRMPNRAELLSLVDRAETNQALRFNSIFYNSNGTIDQPVVFTSFQDSEFYWTSTTAAFDTTQAWTLYSCDFGVYNIGKAALGYSLAVR